MTTRDSERPTYTWEQTKRECDLIGDAAFVAAMRNAIRWKRENPRIGVDKRFCTERPRFIPHQPRPVVRVTSREDTS